MRIHAFTGLTYSHDEPGRLAAPPYDQIGERAAAEMHALDPHHFTWLTRPVPGEAGDIYREADRLHHIWREGGVVARDSRPTLYPCAIKLPDGSRRLGITALVGLEPPATGVIRPHEETLAKPLADRLALLRAMEVDLEPVLLLSEDGGELDRLLADDIGRGPAFASYTDAFGNRHLLYRVSDPERIARYRDLLAGSPAAIADGHHRYKVALEHAKERGLLASGSAAGADSGETPPPAAATKLAVITSLASPALDIQPIHRALEDASGLARAADAAASRTPVAARSGEELAAAVAAAEQPAIGVVAGEGPPEIWRFAGGGALPPEARGLAVAQLHGTVFPAMGLPDEAATDGTVLYRSSTEQVWEEVRSGKAAAGFWLPPMEPAAFAAAIAGGQMLPPKSTRFLPKVVSGMVWADHAAELG